MWMILRIGFLLTVLNELFLLVIIGSFAVDEEDACRDVCRCHDRVITCRRPETLETLPLSVNQSFLEGVTEIFVENQHLLKDINSRYLKKFPRLQKLTVRRSGIEAVHENTFKFNPHLTSINLAFNNITTFSWLTVDGLKISELILAGNPLVCDCKAKWLQELRKIPVDEEGASLSCTEFKSNAEFLIDEYNFKDCEYPSIVLTSNVTAVHAGMSVQATCTSTGSNPVDTLRWKTEAMTGTIYQSFSRSESELVLVINDTTSEDSQVISCLAENLVGRTEKRWTLLVHSAPQILQLLPPFEAFNWIISYEVAGLPTPNITWIYNGQPLDISEENQLEDVLLDTKKLGRLAGRLTFKLTSHAYNGNYTLLVVNEYGADSKSIEALFLVGPGEDTLIQSRYPPFNLPDGETASTPEHSTPAFTQVVPEMKSSLLTTDRVMQVSIPSFVGLLVVLFIVFFVFYIRRRRQNMHEFANEQDGGTNGCLHLICPRGKRSVASAREHSALETIPLNATNMVENPNYLKRVHSTNTMATNLRHIPRRKIRLIRELGEGNFGRVYLGMCDLRLNADELTTSDDVMIPVAVKTLKENHAEGNQRDFERETELLMSLSHRNIVTFYGISDDGEMRMIVLEYMENGDLNSYLRSHGPDQEVFGKTLEKEMPLLSLSELLHISNQVAAGVSYLACQHFVHRDLATRNCLVGDKLQIKIGDFGMSRDVYSTDYYKVGGQAMLPVRWMPAESILYSTFTVESDLWSLGVVLWEIFSYGKQPWYELSNKEVMEQVELGRQLECPRDCPRDVYNLMCGCWHRVPHERTSITEIHSRLGYLLQRYSAEEQDSPVPQYLEII